MTQEEKMISLPLGIVIRRSPGATRWNKWVWKATGLLPGAGAADWHLLREDGNITEYHAGTLPLDLYRTDTEAYLGALNAPTPSVFVILAHTEAGEIALHKVTASPYEAQDYLDSGEEIVEPVPMPDGLIAWIRDFVDRHHRDEPFIKRKRDKTRIDAVEDGKGDARIRQMADVYRAPGKGRLQ